MATNYVKCPRCELNYIDEKADVCDICKSEIGESLTVLEEEDLKELCPICKRTLISYDEDMCDECRLMSESKIDSEDNDDWRAYLDDEPEAREEESIEIPLEDLRDSELEETFPEEEEEEYVDDDFEDDFENYDDFDDDFDDDLDDDDLDDDDSDDDLDDDE